MSALLEKYAGKIDLIYIDPPFATGAILVQLLTIGDNEIEVQKKLQQLKN
jgi:adenine-specific DNA-methyltransferase